MYIKYCEIIICMQSAFELKGKKTVKQLLQCLELDPSMYIRIQVCYHVMVYHVIYGVFLAGDQII